jgi:DNA-binding MarR family transcriptional regulator
LTKSSNLGTVLPVADDSVDRIERSLETLLRLSASRRVHDELAAAAGVDISRPGLVLLKRIQEDGPLPLGELSRRIHMDPAVTGRQIRQLEAAGFVTRAPSATDGRVTFATVTREGAEARGRISAVQEQHMFDVLDAWSARDRQQLGRLLERFVDDLLAARYRPPEAL